MNTQFDVVSVVGIPESTIKTASKQSDQIKEHGKLQNE
jgi:hypothetical protein